MFQGGRPVRVAALSSLAVLAAGVSAGAQQMPQTMEWSTCEVGSAGYGEASAVADAFGQKFGTKICIQPSGRSIGRLQHLLKGRADYGFIGT